MNLKTSLFAIIAYSIAIYLFQACDAFGDGDDFQEPDISNFFTIAGEVRQGQEVTFSMSVTDEEGLDRLEILETRGATTNMIDVINFTDLNEENVDYSYFVPNDASDGEEIHIEFVLYDNDDGGNEVHSVSQEAFLILWSPMRMDMRQFGQIYNQHGTSTCIFGYNLVDHVNLTNDDTDDVRDIRSDNDENTFDGSFRTYTVASFVKATSEFDYENASVETLQEDPNSRIATGFINAPQEGDVYFTYIIRAERHYMIKILDIDPGNDDCANTGSEVKTGKVYFEYKWSSAQ